MFGLDCEVRALRYACNRRTKDSDSNRGSKPGSVITILQFCPSKSRRGSTMSHKYCEIQLGEHVWSCSFSTRLHLTCICKPTTGESLSYPSHFLFHRRFRDTFGSSKFAPITLDVCQGFAPPSICHSFSKTSGPRVPRLGERQGTAQKGVRAITS